MFKNFFCNTPTYYIVTTAFQKFAWNPPPERLNTKAKPCDFALVIYVCVSRSGDLGSIILFN